MSYKLRFVQLFRMGNAKEFLAIEKKFAEYENKNPQAPKGKRYLPCAGKEASNTLIWECDFPSLEEAHKAQAFLLVDSEHDDLFQQQAEYMIESFTEIYRPYDS